MRERLAMLLNSCLDRRGIDLAISTCLGRHKKSFFPIKTMKGGTLWQIKKSNQKASAVIGADFFVLGLI